MDKPNLDPKQVRPATERLTLAEEQRLAFEQDRERRPRPILSLRFPGGLFRN